MLTGTKAVVVLKYDLKRDMQTIFLVFCNKYMDLYNKPEKHLRKSEQKSKLLRNFIWLQLNFNAELSKIGGHP
jgi:hypothetical protein